MQIGNPVHTSPFLLWLGAVLRPVVGWILLPIASVVWIIVKLFRLDQQPIEDRYLRELKFEFLKKSKSDSTVMILPKGATYIRLDKSYSYGTFEYSLIYPIGKPIDLEDAKGQCRRQMALQNFEPMSEVEVRGCRFVGHSMRLDLAARYRRTIDRPPPYLYL